MILHSLMIATTLSLVTSALLGAEETKSSLDFATLDKMFDSLKPATKASIQGSWSGSKFKKSRSQRDEAKFVIHGDYLFEEVPGEEETTRLEEATPFALSDGAVASPRGKIPARQLKRNGEVSIVLKTPNQYVLFQPRPDTPPEKWSESWRPNAEKFAKFKEPVKESDNVAKAFVKGFEQKDPKVFELLSESCRGDKGKPGRAGQAKRFSGFPDTLDIRSLKVKRILFDELEKRLLSMADSELEIESSSIDREWIEAEIGVFSRKLLGSVGFIAIFNLEDWSAGNETVRTLLFTTAPNKAGKWEITYIDASL